jgi:hypothetical protein
MTDDGGNFQKGLLNYYFIAINQQPNETAVEEKPPTLGVFKVTCSAIKCYIEFDSDRNGPQLTRTGLDLITHLPFHCQRLAGKILCHCSSLLPGHSDA